MNNVNSRPRYAWYVVSMLTVAYVFSFMDRSILALLIAPIKADLGLSDTQVSLLHGFAFAMFYATMGIPLGRLADRRNRVRIIVFAMSVWSVFTATCGLARNFVELFIMRALVGVGESALNPCAYSMISDSVPQSLLSRALSVYAMGIYLGAGIAYIVGGIVVSAVLQTPTIELPLLGEVKTWKTVFFYVGLPGLVMVSAFMLTVREPTRKNVAHLSEAGKGVPLAIIGRFAKDNRLTLLTHIFGFSLVSLLANGVSLWTPTFFNRTYGWDVAYAGIMYGTVLLVCGPLGSFAAGWLSDHVDRRGPQGGPFKVGLVFALLTLAPAVVSPLVADPYVSLGLIAILVFFLSGPIALAISALQQITPNEMRGQVSAVYLLILNFLGIGFGPTLVALITDYGFGDDMALRYSMAIVGAGASVSSILLLAIGTKPFRDSLKRAEEWAEPEQEELTGNEVPAY